LPGGELEEKAGQKKIVGGRLKNKPDTEKDERTVDEKSVAEKVSEAIASGLIDNSRVVKDDDDDKESVIEKDQIEEMENSPNNDANKEFMKDENDEDEPELQQIGDEDDQADDGPFPDIDTKLVQEENVHRNLNLNLVNEEPCNELPEEKVVSKLAFNPVKTPDEVEDLPEHEVAGNGEEIMEIEFKEEQDVEKCSVDEYKKESKDFEKDKSETSVEAVRDNEVVIVAIDQKMSENLDFSKEKRD
jgi:hypothetical protein